MGGYETTRRFTRFEGPGSLVDGEGGSSGSAWSLRCVGVRAGDFHSLARLNKLSALDLNRLACVRLPPWPRQRTRALDGQVWCEQLCIVVVVCMEYLSI